jgi:sporulation protein YlmC with PRC-barrel domain
LTPAFADDNKGLLDSIFPGKAGETRPITPDQLKMALSVRDYLDLDVINEQGERLGRVTDLILKQSSGDFDRAVISVGGVLGLGRALLSIPFEELEQQPGARAFVWKVSSEQFETLVAQARPPRSSSKRSTASNQTADAERSSAAVDADVRRAQTAIQEDQELRSYSPTISIEKIDGRLVVEGAVDSKARKEKLLALVKTTTSCEVVDELKVN